MFGFCKILLRQLEGARPTWARGALPLALAAALVAWAAPASADLTSGTTTTTSTDTTLTDPLHGYCGAGCPDKGSNSPTSSDPLTNFGFTISPGPNTGSNFLLEILIPDTVPNAGSQSFTVSGTDPNWTGTVTQSTSLVGLWKQNNLYKFLGIPQGQGAPNNPFGGFFATPGMTGFDVYQVKYNSSISSKTPSTYLADQSCITAAGAYSAAACAHPSLGALLLSISQALPKDTSIVGFLNLGTKNSPDWIGTALSGTILETPEPGSLALLSTGLIGLAFLRRVRRKSAPQPAG